MSISAASHPLVPSSPAALSRTASLLGVRILATGGCAAERIVRNEELLGGGYDGRWIVQRTGIVERRHAPDDVATSDLACEAAARCLARAAVDPGEVDLVLVGTYTPDYLMPATASLVQSRLGLRAPAMDIQAACTSFVHALWCGMQFVATGCCRRVLVIGADTNTRVVDPSDEKTAPLFGDAAGAVLLGPGAADCGALAYAAGSDGAGAELLYRPMGGSRRPFSPAPDCRGAEWLTMDGPRIFKWAVRALRETTELALQSAGLAAAAVDLVVYHQANLRIIEAAVKELGIARDRVVNQVARFGNTASASVPLALDEALQQGRIAAGSLVLLSGFGGGLSWGTMLLRW